MNMGDRNGNSSNPNNASANRMQAQPTRSVRQARPVATEANQAAKPYSTAPVPVVSASANPPELSRQEALHAQEELMRQLKPKFRKGPIIAVVAIILAVIVINIGVISVINPMLQSSGKSDVTLQSSNESPEATSDTTEDDTRRIVFGTAKYADSSAGDYVPNTEAFYSSHYNENDGNGNQESDVNSNDQESAEAESAGGEEGEGGSGEGGEGGEGGSGEGGSGEGGEGGEGGSGEGGSGDGGGEGGSGEAATA